MAIVSGELSNICPVRYSARLRSVMSMTVASTLSNPAEDGGKVIVKSTVSSSPLRVWRTVSASNNVRPSAIATSCSIKTSDVSATKILSSEASSSALLSAANSLTVTAFTSTTFTIAIASCTNGGCVAKYPRKSRTPLDLRSSIAALTREKSSSQIDTPVDSKMWR